MEHLEILRPTVAAKRRVVPGDIVEVDFSEARILIASNKARRLVDEPAGGPMTTRSAGGIVEGAPPPEQIPQQPDSNVTADLAAMTKNQLEAFGRDELGIELDRRKSKADMIADIQSAMKGNEDAE